jgi:hypothetical protein
MGKSFQKRLNHVIFLGAGASATSGYPIGQELRLRMASQKHFDEELKKHIRLDLVLPEPRNAYGKCLNRFADFNDSVELFRHGGFGSVDEFSKLASAANQEHVQNMKKLMRIVLSAHNPEEKFHDSDYYSFIQRLFRDDKLDELRSDITVITYNYDCYLDFLLLEAFRHRQKLSENPQELNDFWCGKLTSGFFDPNGQRDWLSQTQGFNYFKLHGSISNGNDMYFGHDVLFRKDVVKRFDLLGEKSIQSKIPPIVFPWELFDGDSGEFISEDEFVFTKHTNDSTEKGKARLLFDHFKKIWMNAKWAVTHADKISFVGLSMHQYMKDGLTYLFEEKSKGVQAVVANHSNEHFRNAENRLHPSSLRGRVAEIFRDVAPNMKYVRSSSEEDGIFRDQSPEESSYTPDITARYSFKEFIEREMD